MSPFLLAILTSGLITWVKEYESAVEQISFVDNHGWVATACNMNQVVMNHERCVGQDMEWATGQGLQFLTTEMEVALLIRRRGHKTHHCPKLTAKLGVRDEFIQFDK